MSNARGISPTVDAYLDELDAATSRLPEDERYEIRSSIEDHIADRLSGPESVSDEEARAVLRELGPVATIVPDSSKALGTSHQPPHDGAHGRERRYGLLAGVLGILAMVLFPLVPVAMTLGLAALVLAFLARHHGERGAWPLAGIILGGMALILPLFLTVGLYSTGGSGSGSTPASSSSAVPYDPSPSAAP